MPSSSRAPRGDSPAQPVFGMQRPPFGIPRGTGHRVEIVFALKSGGTLTAFHHLGSDLDEESFARFFQELQQQVERGQGIVTFSDAWGATGSRAWVDLGSVSGFTARPLR